MRKYIYSCIALSALLGHMALAATQIYKCTTDNGAVIFSDSGCPTNSAQQTHNLNAPMLIPALSQQDIQQALSKQQSKALRVTVISDDNHPCGTFDASQRRTDLIRKQVKSGMSRAEVDSMFGRPLHERNNNGNLSVTYRTAKNKKRSVRFNQDGCVP